ncbi:ATP-binding protein [Pelomonas sp. SE-A7]|uniref:ATP-binding protein n=1 Tax=Pelomonas sp. SE-A7 TaxID=3054953 RepID=UPI00259CB6B8|nr:ATP-binding protein [Pelomonas sp. SE-A7]MDM4765618.1 ATP-binding protein [Pelomonas sp. SE-A7]
MKAPNKTGRGTPDEDRLVIRAQVRAERIATLYALTAPPLALGLLFSLVVTGLLWSYLPHTVLGPWMIARSLLVALRAMDAWRFRRAAPGPAESARWECRYLTLLGLDAISWGAMGWLFHTPSLPELDGIVLASVVGLGSVGLVSLGCHWRANVLFTSLAFAPLAAYQLMQGTTLGAFIAAGLLLVLTTLGFEARRSHARHSELLRLRFESARTAEQRQQQLESAEQSSTSKSRFVAMLSHEIRTPLNGILGMTQLLSRGELQPQQREQVEIVRRSGRHLLALVNDILDLARIESGKLAVDAGPVDVAEIANDVCALLGHSAREKGLRFELQIAPGLPAQVLGDASRIKQVLHNLIGNAIKFTERGHVSVRLNSMLDMRAGNQIRFAVQDSGEGIPADQMERIFAPFEQAAAGLRRHEGAGLGLTISRELARAMGGDLCCSSAPGQGSRFEFTLPLRSVASAAEEAANSDADAAPQLRGRVLVVDDSAVNLLVASAMLESAGLQVEQAESGLQALNKLQHQALDLVLMDCQMQGLDGLETTRRWRQLEAEMGRPRLPVIALTASAVNGDRDRCLAAGMDDYLLKPFEQEALTALLARHLRATEKLAA